MTLQLYNANTDRKIRDKQKTELTSVAIVKGKNIDSNEPSFIIKMISGFNNINYVQFNGKYYFAKVKVIDNNFVEITCHSDVLANVDLTKVKGVLELSSSQFNKFANNKNNFVIAQKRFQCYKFDKSLPELKIVLNVQGKGGN